MNEMDWPPNDVLALRIVQRLAVAVASIEALIPTRPEYPTDTSALRAARDLAVSIRSAIDAGTTPEQMEDMFADMTTALPKALKAWDTDQWVFSDASEWSVEQERRDKLNNDFKTLRARLYPDGLLGQR